MDFNQKVNLTMHVCNDCVGDKTLVVRNLCNDGLIGTGPFPGRTGLMETIAEQSGFPPVISKMLDY